MPSPDRSLLDWVNHTVRNSAKSLLPRRSQRYQELARLVAQFDSKSPPDILLLGDSVTERISRLDKDKRSLGDLVTAKFKEWHRLLCISHSAYHMEVYRALLDVLRTTQHKPSLVILPINMRSFSPQWHLEPSWQFDSELGLLEKYLSDSHRAIPFLDSIDTTSEQYEAFDATDVEYPCTSLDRIGQFRLVISAKPQTAEQFNFRKKQIFIFHYLHKLKTYHPRVRSLAQISRMLREMKIALLCYVTPLNYQAGNRFVGGMFSELVQKNVKVISQSLPSNLGRETQWLDLSMCLGSDQFFNHDDPTEHLNEHGRDWLSSEIFKAGMEMLASKGNRSL